MFSVRNQEIIFDPEATDTLTDAVIVSLFSMKQAPPESTQDEQGGYWADLTDGNSMGSCLWLFSREVPGEETLFRIRQEALSALEWLKRDGIVRDLSVRVFTEESQLILDISLDSSSMRMKVP
ncbi:MAG: phage GP46 family protein [Deltaproteobacteria bacterium]|nr:phage GP46 family protein [Deltaproteobacteria bacterium]